MAILNDDQIAQVAVNNGFPTSDPNNLAVCVAIAKAESGGKTDINNAGLNSDGSVDYGLWQINSVHDDKLPGQDRYDPNVNAQLMMMISSNGTNWQPWSTYGNGAYQAQLPEAIAAVSGKQYTVDPSHTLGGGSGSGSTEKVSSNPVSGIENFFSGLANPDTLMRIGQVWGGAIIILVGVIFFFRDPIMKATEKVSKVAEVAAI